jgi:formylmethanofuran dehydrogenase subunit A
MSDIVPVLTEAIWGTEADVKKAAHHSLAKANACQMAEPEHILRAVIDKYDRTRIGSSVSRTCFRIQGWAFTRLRRWMYRLRQTGASLPAWS